MPRRRGRPTLHHGKLDDLNKALALKIPKKHTARVLGMGRSTLYRMLAKQQSTTDRPKPT